MPRMSMQEILDLSVAERLELAEQIWESIAEKPEMLPVSDAQKEELERRLEAHRRDPSSAIPWDEVKEKLKRN